MSNLCQEITLPTDPIQHIDGEGEIALCILSAINVGQIDRRDELEELCDIAEILHKNIKIPVALGDAGELNEQKVKELKENLYG